MLAVDGRLGIRVESGYHKSARKKWIESYVCEWDY
jgi:hypothetical protein